MSTFQSLVALYRAGKFRDVVSGAGPHILADPGNTDLLKLAGAAHLALRDWQQAKRHFDKALATSGDPQVWNGLGIAERELGHLDQAENCFKETLKRAPRHGEALLNLANLALQRDDLDAAIEGFETASACLPPSAELQNNFGIARLKSGDARGAITHFLKALDISPRHAEAANNLGTAQKALGDWKEAAASYATALTLRPDFADAAYNLGVAETHLGALDRAVEAFDRAIGIEAGHAAAKARRAHVLAHMCDWGAIGDIVDLGIRGQAISPFSLLALEDAPHRHFLRAKRFTEKTNGQLEAAPAMPKTGDKIRVGYFSADFHDHATMHLMAGVFEAHDRDAFEIHGVSYGPERSDPMRTRARAAMHGFHDVRSLGDREAAALARRLNLDIAVDLKGYTENARLGIHAHRPAPLQMTYLGYPGSLGAPFIDYLVGDPFVTPEGCEGDYSEAILRLPHCYQANDGTRAIASNEVTRSSLGLPEDAFVFCSFNNNYKISGEVFAIWMRLLSTIEGSVLWLLESNRWARANMTAHAARHGVAPDRLVFAEKAPHAEHLARHRAADLFLDTFAYNAHTTASDALWAGLPVLTYSGQQFAARVAGSLLTTLGLDDLIASDPAAYEAKAIGLARDPAAMVDLKARLATALRTAPLYDTARFTAGLEDGFRLAHARRLAGQAPQSFSVPAT